MKNKITHEEAKKALDCLIYNEYYYDVADEKERLRYYINQQEKQEKLLELYKEFYNSLKPTIEYIDDEDYDEEYLDIGGATWKTLEIVKEIKELEDE